MIRPLFIFSCAFVAAAALLCCLPIVLPWLPALLVLAGVAFSLEKPALRPYGYTVCGGALIACLAFWLFSIWVITPFAQLDQQTATMRASVLSTETHTNYARCTLYGEFPEYPNLPTTTVQVLVLGECDLSVGDRVEGALDLSLPEDAASRRIIYAQGRWISGLVAAGELRITTDPVPQGLATWGAGLRRDLDWAITRAVPGKIGGLVSALLLSEKGNLSPTIDRQIKQSGTAHVLVVSGFHLTLITTMVMGLMRCLGMGKWLTTFGGMASCILVMSVVGFTPSIVRSGVMMLLFLAAKLVGRQSDSYTSLGFAALVIVLSNPYMVLSWSFLLSAGSVLSILLFFGPIHDFFHSRMTARHAEPGRMSELFLSALSVTLAASVLIYPLQSVLFGGLPTYGPLGNALITPLVPLLLVGGGLAAGCGLLGWWGVARTIGLGVSVVGTVVVEVAAFIFKLPASWLPITEKYQLIWLWSAAACAVVLVFAKLSTQRVRIVCTGLVAALLVGAISFGAINRQTVEFVTSGEGLVVRRGSVALLIGPATPGEAETLGARDILLIGDDSLYPTAATTGSLIQEATPEMVLLAEDTLTELTPYLPPETTILNRAGTTVEALDGLTIHFTEQGLTLIEMRQMRLLKLSPGYDIMGKEEWLERLDAVILPDGIISPLNPDLIVTEEGQSYRLRVKL